MNAYSLLKIAQHRAKNSTVLKVNIPEIVYWI